MANGDTVLLRCVDDAAYQAAALEGAEAIINEALSWAAIQTALMVMRRTTQTAITDLQEELASRRVGLAEELLAHAQETWVKEKALVDAAMGEALATPNYSETAMVQAEASRVQELALRRAVSEAECSGTALSQCDISRMNRGLATARTDFVGHAMRTAEARAIQFNDRRYSRQLTVLGMGHRRLQTAMTLGALGSATNDALRSSLMSTINSGMELWGYTTTRWQHGQNYASGPNAPVNVLRGAATMFSDGRYAQPTPSVNVTVMTDTRADENGVPLPSAETFNDLGAF